MTPWFDLVCLSTDVRVRGRQWVGLVYAEVAEFQGTLKLCEGQVTPWFDLVCLSLDVNVRSRLVYAEVAEYQRVLKMVVSPGLAEKKRV